MDISTEDHAAFWRSLGESLRAGMPVVQALVRAGEATGSDAWRAIAATLAERLARGETLSQAVRAPADVFDEPIARALRAGEESGVLDVAALQVAAAVAAGNLALLAEPPTGEPGEADVAAAVPYVHRLLRQAIELHASDIHLDAEPGGGRVRLRVRGALREVEPPPAETFRDVVDRFKALGAMDAAQRKLPQNGRCMVRVDDRPVDLAISTMPALFGERLVARLLDRERVRPRLAEIGLAGGDLEAVRALGRLQNGLIIAAGPAGSGKTTLLYSMLGEINEPGRCILTVEDPVECTLAGISQVQIEPRIGWTYAAAARQILRQDGDVALIAELRDLEVMNLAVQFAMTGHLLLSTMHTNDAAATVTRLLDCGIEPFLVGASLAGVVATRLVRTLCPQCKAPAQPAEPSLPIEAVEAVRACGRKGFFRPVGCDACRGTGYRGRTGLFEILVMDDRIRQLLGRTPDESALRRAARAGGMKTLLAAGMEQAARGVTSIEEVLRVVPLWLYG